MLCDKYCGFVFRIARTALSHALLFSLHVISILHLRGSRVKCCNIILGGGGALEEGEVSKKGISSE